MDDTTFMDGNKAAFAMIKPSADESTEITTKPLVSETAVAATETRSNSGVKSWFNRILKKGDADKAGDKQTEETKKPSTSKKSKNNVPSVDEG